MTTEIDPVASLAAAVQRQLAAAGVTKRATAPRPLLAYIELAAVRSIAAGLVAAAPRASAMERPSAVAICAAAREAASREAERMPAVAATPAPAARVGIDLAARVLDSPRSGLAAVFAAAHNRLATAAELAAL